MHIFKQEKPNFSSIFVIFTLFISFLGFCVSSTRGEPTSVAQPNCSGILPHYLTTQDEIILGAPSNYPMQGVLNSSSHKIFWFLQITDTQMIWSKWGQNERRPLIDSRVIKMRTFLNTTQAIISPMFIINTGDLVDSSYESYFYRTQGQKLVEWEHYNETMQEFGMNSSYYFDIIGNHDIYRDPGFTHYLNYSVSGSTFKTDQYVITADLGFGTYTFYALSTPEDYGLEFPFALGGHLSQRELNWLEGKMIQKAGGSNRTFVFGHHPIGEIYSERSSTGKNLLEIFTQYGVNMYLFGHGHENKFEQFGSVIAYETAKIDEGDGTYRIVAVDDNGISTTEQTGSQWPAGLITAPLDVKNTRTNEDLQKNMNQSKIRALAWDILPIQKVEWRADRTGLWNQMHHIEGPLYEGEFSNSLKDGSDHLIEVRITNLDGKETIKTITFRSAIVNFVKFADFQPFLLISFIGICIVVSVGVLYVRKNNPTKYGKRPESIVNKEQAKLVLVKFIVLICVPLSLGFMYAEQITLMFGLFLVGSSGIMYSDVVLILFSVISIWILFQSFSLSDKSRFAMRIFTKFSIFFVGFIYLFFLLHYPLIAWCSPGLLLLLVLDGKILKK